ncbi:tetratricopeptide repeat protein [Paenirhodobacter populi]|uniref:tetratricopeptide repeat protein n=1 Tax=Paenirhodobacter populi TaxID=2306993 RepID=UPI000FE3D785|nr:tetratricopeptide repeat protein [Sinirhodobacter populi]RWR07321.1 hypothetical protein D2T32_11630 [Sinirhodobacter populi]
MNVKVQIERAEELMSAKRFCEAELEFKKIAVSEENFPRGVYYRLAIALKEQDKYQEAENILEEVLKKYPDYSAAADLYDIIRAERSQRYTLTMTSLSNCALHMDAKTTNIPHVSVSNFELHGWVGVYHDDCQIIINQKDGNKSVVDLCIERHDVVLHLKKKGVLNCSVYCGFKSVVDLRRVSSMDLVENGVVRPIWNFQLKREMQVVEGSSGWLFLGNDTNKSIDIFTGKVTLDRNAIDLWEYYIRDIKSILGGNACFVISPSKEDVFPEYHPLLASPKPLVNSIVSLLERGRMMYSCPINRLRQNSKSYYATDTYWSDEGAYICLADALQSLGETVGGKKSFRFMDKEVIGDLGSKLNPPRKSIKSALVETDSPKPSLYFDNKISGSGSIQIYDNNDPEIDETVLIFGGSSSSQLAKLSSRIFSRVVRINCPSFMPIMEVIEKVRPDKILLQTNSRYMMNPPKLVEKIKDAAPYNNPQVSFPLEWNI